MKTARKLFPQRHRLAIKNQNLSTHDPVILVNVATNEVLDADCVARSLLLVSREEAVESWRTGVNWHFTPQKNGTWDIRNQGQAKYMFAASRDGVHLLDLTSNIRARGAEWTVFHHTSSGAYALRPKGESWLTLTEGALSLDRFTGEIPEASLWKIEHPAHAQPVAEPVVEAEPVQLSFPLRVRRVLGRIKRKIM
jgi:hypothetical protein